MRAQHLIYLEAAESTWEKEGESWGAIEREKTEKIYKKKFKKKM